MHHSTKRRVVLGMTTGGLLLTGVGMSVAAQADASADGAATRSPGLLSGNVVQAPIDAPINLCGNVIDVVGVLNSAAGNHCGNADAGSGAPRANTSSAHGVAEDSPGLLSGNLVQAPINAPINLCGNSVSGVGVGNAAFDNSCSNGGRQGTNGAGANGGSSDSPGLGSGNTVQLPIDTPVNVCGNSVSGVGVGNAAFDNTCSNGDVWLPPPPPGHTGPTPCGCHPSHGGGHTAPRRPGPVARPTNLAETGTDVGGLLAPLGASMLGGGGLLLLKQAPSSGG